MKWLDDTTVHAEQLCPAAGAFDPAQFLAARPGRPFAEDTVAFIADFAGEVSRDPEARRYPEIVALGFWMRRANITRIKDSFESAYAGRYLVGRGLVFHIAPSNVDTMFIYSLFLSLLAGNTNIVRVSEKLTAQFVCVIRLLNAALERHPAIASRLLLVRYGHDDTVTRLFSNLCNARVIWGGDETVSKIRAIPLPPHAFELAFSGKFSVAVLDAETWNAAPDQDAVAKSFCNDSFTFNQQGCASPKLVYWRGTPDAVDQARATFWPSVERAAARMPAYAIEGADVMNRFVAVCAIGLKSDGDVEKAEAENRAFVRMKVSRLEDVLRDENTGGGLFYEAEDTDLSALLAWFGDTDQTVSSYGIPPEQWQAALRDHAPKGICRIVRLGQALEFSPVWDGYDIVRFLSREVCIEL